MTIDELELELRRLDGVHAAGFVQQDEVLCVQVCVDADVDDSVTAAAARIAARHAEQLVTVELVRARPPVSAGSGNGDTLAHDMDGVAGGAEIVVVRPEPRVELLAVLVFPETNELEVHVAFDGQRVIGRADAEDEMPNAVRATLKAIGAFLPEPSFGLTWAKALETGSEAAPVIVVGLVDPESGRARYGVASATRVAEATAKATLHALNRTIAPELR